MIAVVSGDGLPWCCWTSAATSGRRRGRRWRSAGRSAPATEPAPSSRSDQIPEKEKKNETEAF